MIFFENKKVGGGVLKIIKIIEGRILNNFTPLHNKLILIMKNNNKFKFMKTN